MHTPVVAVVDDDASVRRALKRLLQSADFHVITYASAAEFLEAGVSRTPGCVILDVHLGGMSGIELLSRLRESGHNLPVVLVTAYDDAQTREAAVQAGCLAYFRKPIDAKALLEQVVTVTKRAA
jgi:FixJ family two-component response regulator